jgi:L-asparagine oxygenase
MGEVTPEVTAPFTKTSLAAEGGKPDAAVFELSDDSRDALLNRLLRQGNPVSDLDSALLTLYRTFAELPDDVMGAIRDLGRYPDVPGVLLLRNLPVDPVLPDTPSDGEPSREKSTFVSDCVVLGLAQLIGEPVGYTTEKKGRLVHDVVPVKGGEHSQTNQSSAVLLSFHNDTTHDRSGYYNRTNPDFLVLVCLRDSPDKMGRTAYVDARWLIRRLDDATVDALRRSEFLLNAPGTYCREHAGGADVWSNPVPLIEGPAETPEIGVSANGVRPLTAEATAAWHVLQEACQQDGVAFRTLLAPGDALLIDNLKGLHAREPFTARFLGRDRWLQRCYVRRSMWSCRHRATDERRVHL